MGLELGALAEITSRLLPPRPRTEAKVQRVFWGHQTPPDNPTAINLDVAISCSPGGPGTSLVSATLVAGTGATVFEYLPRYTQRQLTGETNTRIGPGERAEFHLRFEGPTKQLRVWSE